MNALTCHPAPAGRLALAAGLLTLLAPAAPAALFLTVGDHQLAADQADPQPVSLWLMNDGPAQTVGSLDLFVQLGIGDGAAPAISSVDLVAGTIFGAANGGQFAFGGNQDQLAYYAITKAGGGSGPAIPPGQSLLATLWIVTEGASEGVSLSLLLGGTDWGDTAYQTDSASPETVPLGILNGTLTLVPEPGEVALAMGLGLAGFALWRRVRPVNPSA